MSADAWRECPQCLARGENKKKEEAMTAKKAYGKVSMEEFDRIRQAELESDDDTEQLETLREDYEISMQQDGKLYIDYACSCTECGFRANFKLNEQYPLSLAKKKK
jgi:hypothetical protein